MENGPMIPFVVFEATCTRLDRIIKRLVVTLIISVVLLFISNIVWVYAWMQYDYAEETTTEEVTVDADSGVANYANNGSMITNGTSEDQKDH